MYESSHIHTHPYNQTYIYKYTHIHVFIQSFSHKHTMYYTRSTSPLHEVKIPARAVQNQYNISKLKPQMKFFFKVEM